MTGPCKACVHWTDHCLVGAECAEADKDMECPAFIIQAALRRSCELLSDQMGSCPVDQQDWCNPPFDCETVCNQDGRNAENCWRCRHDFLTADNAEARR